MQTTKVLAQDRIDECRRRIRDAYSADSEYVGTVECDKASAADDQGTPTKPPPQHVFKLAGTVKCDYCTVTEGLDEDDLTLALLPADDLPVGIEAGTDT